jgi:hypothetical protein
MNNIIMDLHQESIKPCDTNGITSSRTFDQNDTIEELEAERQKLLIKAGHYRKLWELEQRYGIILTQPITVDSSLEEIKFELELQMKRIRRRNIYRKLKETSKAYGLELSREFTLDDKTEDMEKEYEHLLMRYYFSIILRGMIVINEKYDIFSKEVESKINKETK